MYKNISPFMKIRKKCKSLYIYMALYCYNTEQHYIHYNLYRICGLCEHQFSYSLYFGFKWNFIVACQVRTSIDDHYMHIFFLVKIRRKNVDAYSLFVCYCLSRQTWKKKIPNLHFAPSLAVPKKKSELSLFECLFFILRRSHSHFSVVI